MAASMSEKLHIVIVGAGIGGLALAVALTHFKLDDFVEVDIYESASELKQVGAGITMFPRSWEILRSFGLEEGLVARMQEDQKGALRKELRRVFMYRKSDQKEGALIADVLMKGGVITFHRADVQDVLLQHVSPNVRFHLSHRLVRYSQGNDKVHLEFKNGVTATCDVLVAADGINSVCRGILLAGQKSVSEIEGAQLGRPVWGGIYVYRSLIDSDVIRKQYPNHPSLSMPMMYIGKNKHVVTYPISQGKFINAAPMVVHPNKEGTYIDGPPIIQNTTDDFMSEYQGWEDLIQIILKNMTNTSRWAVQTVNPLDTYVSGRVILIGDAAHAMTPYLGSGAGQAIEDAYVLSNLIAKSVLEGRVDISKIASAHNSVRKPFGNFVAEASRIQGKRCGFSIPGFEDILPLDIVSSEKLEELGKALSGAFDWTHESAADDLERALSML